MTFVRMEIQFSAYRIRAGTIRNVKKKALSERASLSSPLEKCILTESLCFYSL